MSFAASAYLRKATSRAKSDVANKLVSMFLHDLSRKICTSLDLSVTDLRYTTAVEAAFGSNCCYCLRPLEKDRTSVEHLEGMNRFRLGLHIPGNVILACKLCNGEKRRDDQLVNLTLGDCGWESFLSHDSTRCKAGCNSCRYWTTIWADPGERAERMKGALERIAAFRSQYPGSLRWSRGAGNSLRERVDALYRGCQEFAANQIQRSVDEAFSGLSATVDRIGGEDCTKLQGG